MTANKRKRPIIEYEPEPTTSECSDTGSTAEEDEAKPILSRKEKMEKFKQELQKETRKKSMTAERQPKRLKRNVIEDEHSTDVPGSEEDDSDSDGEEYEMDKIVARKYTNGKAYYRIRWTGYAPYDDTWEPSDNIPSELIEAFDKTLEKSDAVKDEVKPEQLRKPKIQKTESPTETESSTDFRTTSSVTGQDLVAMGVARDKWLDGPKILTTTNKEYGHFGELFKTFDSRKECSKAGIMKPQQCGISGKGQAPADALVCQGTGGYGATDYGNVIIYSGQGGGFNKDQTLSEYNLSLKTNMDEKVPVRVVRSNTVDSKFAPLHAYRYDGIYFVTAVWSEKLLNGKGPKVYRFRLVRCPGQKSIPTRNVHIRQQAPNEAQMLIEREHYQRMLDQAKISKAKKTGSQRSGSLAIQKIKHAMSKEGSLSHGGGIRSGRMTIPKEFA
jgi:hypothetical protein